jgi:hypothetical protein
LGGLTAVALVAAVVGVVVLSDSGPDHPDEWDSRVADLAAFVESERGLTYDHPVFVDFLTDDEYGDRVRVDDEAVDDAARAEMDDSVSTLRALGLASGEVDLFEAGNDMVDSGTLAFYDPITDRVSVKGTEMTVGLRVTLVHELTHALQDQRFDLQDLQARLITDATIDNSTGATGDEGATEVALADSATSAAFAGFQALVEGDAVRIENAYVDSLSPQEQDEYFAGYQEDLDEAEADLGGVPAALLAFQAAPYALGQPLVDLVAADGGNQAVDAMFDDLPSTEEHMLDPLTYIDRDEPSDLDVPELPDASGDIVDQGTMGAVELYVVLGERIDPLVALDAADGWGNATFLSYEQDGRTCVRLLADGETAQDDQQLRSALGTWADAAPDGGGATAQSQADGSTLVESCDPGADAAAGNDRALDVLAVAAARSQVSALAVASGLDARTGWEQGNCFVHRLTFDQLVTVNDLSGPPPADLQAVIDDAFATCGASI